MSKYTKRPITVEAMQVPNRAGNLGEFEDWRQKHGLTGNLGWEHKNPCVLVIDTLEGMMLAEPGDWIVKGIEGELYPVKDSIFKKTFVEQSE